jgi:hypothetical protein
VFLVQRSKRKFFSSKPSPRARAEAVGGEESKHNACTVVCFDVVSCSAFRCSVVYVEGVKSGSITY